MDNSTPIIGVLALQGCVQPHRPHIEATGGVFRAVKTEEQLGEIDGLILPGGESTTMLKLINRLDLKNALESTFANKPIWGICAGAILMAEDVENPHQEAFGLLPVRATRNAYGRQLDSQYQTIHDYTVSYIRAPQLTCLPNDNSNVEILAERDGSPVWIQKDHYMATTFHPEMTLSFPSPMHIYFKDMILDQLEYKQRHREIA